MPHLARHRDQASLHFTLLVPRSARTTGSASGGQESACDAISGGSDGPLGTITHHHAVGVDHAPYLGAEIGALGLEVLGAVKEVLDPAGVLNPGKLITR